MKDKLKQETIDDLCKVYGELMAEYEDTRDYFEKSRTEISMAAISHLLDLSFKSKHTSISKIIDSFSKKLK